MLVPHELEGSLGHATAAAAAAGPAGSLSPAIVSLDVGGGSFQAQRPLLDACYAVQLSIWKSFFENNSLQ